MSRRPKSHIDPALRGKPIPLSSALYVHLPKRGWSTNAYGYVIYTSTTKNPSLNHNFPRGTRRCRAVISVLLSGLPLNPDWEVHHMDFNKLHDCPSNLLYCPYEFNNVGSRRDPYTGEFLSREEFARRYR